MLEIIDLAVFYYICRATGRAAMMLKNDRVGLRLVSQNYGSLIVIYKSILFRDYLFFCRI